MTTKSVCCPVGGLQGDQAKQCGAHGLVSSQLCSEVAIFFSLAVVENSAEPEALLVLWRLPVTEAQELESSRPLHPAAVIAYVPCFLDIYTSE